MLVEKPLISDLDPESVVEAVQREIIVIQEFRRELRKAESEREKAIETSIAQGRISLLVGNISKAKTRRVQIFCDAPQSQLNIGFAKVWQNDPPKEEIPLYDAKPWHIKMPPQTDIANLEDVAVNLSAFIQRYYPQAAHTPIWIYTRPSAHSRREKPEVTLIQL